MASTDTAAAEGIRFGNVIVPIHAGSAFRIVAGEVGATRGALLHLVVQHGRVFQQEHPDVPVIHDGGRFLLVALTPDEAARLGEPSTPCYGLQAVAPGDVAFEVADSTTARRAPIPWITGLVDGIGRAAFQQDLARLAGLRTRHSWSGELREAALWAQRRLRERGYRTRRQNITVQGRPSLNVIADRAGSAAQDRRLVIVTAHLDSINLHGGPASAAPGGDDNASGSAGVLAMARALSNLPASHDLRFILFGGEEQGLFGSKHYVAGLASAERRRISAVINMDMIGSRNTPSPTVLLEGAAVSQSVMNKLATAAATYTGLTVQTSLNPFASDHVPFIQAGIPAVLTIEGADSANHAIHTDRDTLDRVSVDLALEILRMNVACVAQEISG